MYAHARGNGFDGTSGVSMLRDTPLSSGGSSSYLAALPSTQHDYNHVHNSSHHGGGLLRSRNNDNGQRRAALHPLKDGAGRPFYPVTATADRSGGSDTSSRNNDVGRDANHVSPGHGNTQRNTAHLATASGHSSRAEPSGSPRLQDGTRRTAGGVGKPHMASSLAAPASNATTCGGAGSGNPNWGLFGRQLSQIAGDVSTSVRQNEIVISLLERLVAAAENPPVPAAQPGYTDLRNEDDDHIDEISQQQLPTVEDELGHGNEHGRGHDHERENEVDFRQDELHLRQPQAVQQQSAHAPPPTRTHSQTQTQTQTQPQPKPQQNAAASSHDFDYGEGQMGGGTSISLSNHGTQPSSAPTVQSTTPGNVQPTPPHESQMPQPVYLSSRQLAHAVLAREQFSAHNHSHDDQQRASGGDASINSEAGHAMANENSMGATRLPSPVFPDMSANDGGGFAFELDTHYDASIADQRMTGNHDNPVSSNIQSARDSNQSGADENDEGAFDDDQDRDSGIEGNDEWKLWQEPKRPPSAALRDAPRARYRDIKEVRQDRKQKTKRTLATIGRIPLKNYLELSAEDYRGIRRLARSLYSAWLEPNIRLAKQDPDRLQACIHKLEHDFPIVADCEAHWKARELMLQVIDNAIDELAFHRRKQEREGGRGTASASKRGRGGAARTRNTKRRSAAADLDNGDDDRDRGDDTRRQRPRTETDVREGTLESALPRAGHENASSDRLSYHTRSRDSIGTSRQARHDTLSSGAGGWPGLHDISTLGNDSRVQQHDQQNRLSLRGVTLMDAAHLWESSRSSPPSGVSPRSGGLFLAAADDSRNNMFAHPSRFIENAVGDDSSTSQPRRSGRLADNGTSSSSNHGSLSSHQHHGQHTSHQPQQQHQHAHHNNQHNGVSNQGHTLLGSEGGIGRSFWRRGAAVDSMAFGNGSGSGSHW